MIIPGTKLLFVHLYRGSNRQLARAVECGIVECRDAATISTKALQTFERAWRKYAIG